MKYTVTVKVSTYVAVEMEADDLQTVIENYKDEVCEQYSHMDLEEIEIDEITDDDTDQQVAYRKGDDLVSTKDGQVLF